MHASSATESPPVLEARRADHRLPRIAAWIALVGSGIVILRALPTAELFGLVERSIGELGPWAPVVFALLYLLAAVLFVPGSALTIAAGAIFGLLGGVAIVSVASTAAAAASFLIARHAARERVRRLAASHRIFGAIDAAIGEGGWRIVALLRLSPAVPFSLGNYLYGLTPIRFGPYLLASWIAMLPGTFLYVYLGVVGRTAATGGSAGPWRTLLLVAGLLATVVVTVQVTAAARRALARTPLRSESSAPSAAPRRVGPLCAAAAVAILLAIGAHLGRERIASLVDASSPADRDASIDAPIGEHSSREDSRNR